MVVVLPEPLTPTTSMTNGRALRSTCNGTSQTRRISRKMQAQRGQQRVGVKQLMATDSLAQVLE